MSAELVLGLHSHGKPGPVSPYTPVPRGLIRDALYPIRRGTVKFDLESILNRILNGHLDGRAPKAIRFWYHNARSPTKLGKRPSSIRRPPERRKSPYGMRPVPGAVLVSVS